MIKKFEEKNKMHLFSAVKDIVSLNGAFSRLASENEESIVETSYNPDDLLSPCAMNIADFCENVTMESCSVKIFESDEGLDYKIL